jgi:hypothetical protein
MRLKKPTISAKTGEKPDRSGSFSKNREESESIGCIPADVIASKRGVQCQQTFSASEPARRTFAAAPQGHDTARYEKNTLP